jgi:hypothetical protein
MLEEDALTQRCRRVATGGRLNENVLFHRRHL